MNKQKYLELSEKTERKFPDGLYLEEVQAELLHAAMGMCTEAGEFLDQLKKHLIYNKDLDSTNLMEELGDMLWYQAIVLRSLGLDEEEVMDRNIQKLSHRFPNNFDENDAIVRDLQGERAILEGKT